MSKKQRLAFSVWRLEKHSNGGRALRVFPPSLRERYVEIRMGHPLIRSGGRVLTTLEIAWIGFDDDGAGHLVVASAAGDAAPHGVDAGGLREEADGGGFAGLDGLVDAERRHVEAMLHVVGGNDELNVRALRNGDAGGPDIPFLHNHLADGVGRPGIGWSLFAAAGHRKYKHDCQQGSCGRWTEPSFDARAC
jgi:hypothetical protein